MRELCRALDVFHCLPQASQLETPDVRAFKKKTDFVVKVKTACECVNVNRYTELKERPET